MMFSTNIIRRSNSEKPRTICAKQDGGGDGTVPINSGAFPLHHSGNAVQQQLGIPGIEHEPAYHEASTRTFTLYALQKIAATAKAPT